MMETSEIYGQHNICRKNFLFYNSNYMVYVQNCMFNNNNYLYFNTINGQDTLFSIIDVS